MMALTDSKEDCYERAFNELSSRVQISRWSVGLSVCGDVELLPGGEILDRVH